MKSRTEPTILGINAVYHETAACLIRGASVVAFAEEERFNRIKKGKPARVDNADELPTEAIEYCLKCADIEWNQIDYIAVGFDPALRSPPMNERTTPGGWGSTEGEAEFTRHLLRLPARVSELARLNIEDRWRWVPHEQAHAASAYYASPFTESAVLTIDGIGESSTAMLAHGRGRELHPLGVVSYPNSLGFLWEKICKFLGFGDYDAGKLMALASFGSPSDFAEPFSELVRWSKGSFEVDLDVLRFRVDEYEPLEKLFGSRRMATDNVGAREAALAAALQQATERTLFSFAQRLREETGSSNLCVSGGVMMNCVGLGRLLADGEFDGVFVQPVAHDAGTAIGAALATLYAETDCPNRWVMQSPYLGPAYSEDTILQAAAAPSLSYRRSSDVATEAAQAIADGKIIGWFQGSSEAGPRALGNRSILADPRRAASKELINLKVKHREFFRPFAPAVLSEHARQWFAIPRESISLRFMSFALPVRPEKQQLVPAIVHVDGSARPQVVEHTINPEFHRLISAFHERTGIPMVINTSFNTDDEPIVCSPSDAVNTLLRTDLDILFMGDLVIENPRLAKKGREPWKRPMRPPFEDVAE